MENVLSGEVLSELPYFNSNVILRLKGEEGREFEMAIHEKSKSGDILLHQHDPVFPVDYTGRNVNIFYTTKFKSMGQSVNGTIRKLNKTYVLISLHGKAVEIPDRRMDKRFDIDNTLVSLNIVNRKNGAKYRNVKSVNISNTGLRLSYDMCSDCLRDKECFKHIKQGDVLDIEMNFKHLKKNIQVEGIIARADSRIGKRKEFFVGIKFNSDPSEINDISKAVRELEALALSRRYGTRLNEDGNTKKNIIRADQKIFSGLFSGLKRAWSI